MLQSWPDFSDLEELKKSGLDVEQVEAEKESNDREEA